MASGDHYFPQDMAQRELSKGYYSADTLRGLGIELTIVSQSNVKDGINAVRRMLDAK